MYVLACARALTLAIGAPQRESQSAVMATTAETEIVREIKEQFAYVALDYDAEVDQRRRRRRAHSRSSIEVLTVTPPRTRAADAALSGRPCRR